MMNFLLPAMVMEIVGALGRGLNRGGGVGGSCLFDFSLIIYPLNYISQYYSVTSPLGHIYLRDMSTILSSVEGTPVWEKDVLGPETWV